MPEGVGGDRSDQIGRIALTLESAPAVGTPAGAVPGWGLLPSVPADGSRHFSTPTRRMMRANHVAAREQPPAMTALAEFHSTPRFSRLG